MTPKKQPPWLILLTIGLAVVLLYFAFRGVNWADMVRVARQGNLTYLTLAWLTLIGAFSLRAMRWRLLLNARQTLPPLTVFWATMAGYLGNSVLPARAGELIRMVLVNRVSRLSNGYILATALTERLIDVVALVLISLGAIMVMPGLPPWLVNAAQGMGLLGLVGMAGLFIAPRLEGWLQRLLGWLPLPEKIHGAIAQLLSQFLQGMQALEQPGRAISFAGLTLVIWLVDASTAIITAAAFDLRMSLPVALLLLAGLGLSSAAPSTPGYVGIYQFVAVTVLQPFGFLQSEALVHVIALQVLNYAGVLTFGVFGLWQLGLNPARLRELAASERIGEEHAPQPDNHPDMEQP